MTRFRVGCTGWGYDDWRGGFYAPGTQPDQYLARYARVFDIAEIDSTYYRAPSRAQVARWAEVTPAGFTFTPKIPGDVTHKAKLRDVDEPLGDFLRALEPLRASGKLGPIVAQLPATFTRHKHEADLHAFLEAVPRDVALAVELRHKSWWTQATYRALEARGAALVWSVNQYADVPPVLTTDWAYARLIGDRALTKFDRVQRDLTDQMRDFVAKLKEQGVGMREAMVLVNNHFMGFAPATAVLVQEALGLPKADISKAAREEGQRGLMEF